MFEDEKHLKVYATQHNKLQGDLRTGKYVRLPSSDYNQIFDREPTFNEKKAFINIFRQKWMQENKHSSMFDRRKLYTEAKSSSQKALSRQQLLKENFRLRMEKRLKEAEQQNQDQQQSESDEETQQRVEIDWQRIASLSKTVASFPSKAKMMFEA